MSSLESALVYAESGWRVFPLHSPDQDGQCSCRKTDRHNVGKHPRTRHGFKDATTDETKVRRWWGKWPDANVGIATGNGLVVLDVDPRHGGLDNLADLEDQYGPLPPTLTATTGGGGRHFHFTTPAPVRSKVALRPGVDIRGDGGYVVAPPSLHESGARYQWENSEPLAPLPDWLRERPVPNGYPVKSRHGTDMWQGVGQGERDNRAVQILGHLVAGGLKDQAALVEKLLYWNEKNQPPMGQAEGDPGAKDWARQKVESVLHMEDRNYPEMKLPVDGTDDWEVLNVDELLAWEYESTPIIGDDILDQGGLLLAEGATEIGKSYFLLQLAMSLATGEPFLGRWSVDRPLRVLLLQAEIGKRRFQQRVAKLWPNFIRGSFSSNLMVMSPYSLKLDDEGNLRKLEAIIVGANVEVVIFDPLRPFHQGDENSSQDMETIFTAFREFQVKHDMAVVYAHHERKPDQFNKKGHGLYESRGSGVITDRPDTVFRLSATSDRSRVTLTVEKLRNSAEIQHPDPTEMYVDTETGLFIPTATTSTGLKTGDVLTLVPVEPVDFGNVADEISQALSVGRKTAERKLTQMDAEGLVAKAVNPDDKRKRLICKVKT